MSGVIKCPNCKTPIFASAEMVGQVMACPTCQRPIQFVGQSSPRPTPGETAGPQPVLGSAQEHRLPKAAPMAGPLTLEAAPAAPKFSVENSQLTLSAASRDERPGRPETQGTIAIITWAAIALLVLGSGVIVVVAGFSGLSQDPADYKPVKVAKTPQAGKPPAARTSDPSASPTSPASAQAAAGSGGSASAPNPAPKPRAVPTDFSKFQNPRRTTSPDANRPAATAHVQPGQQKTTPANDSAPATTAEPPPPAKPDALSGLESAWSLPALISKNEEPLGSLSLDPTEPVNVSLSSTAAAIGAQAAIYAQRGESTGTWTVLYVADLQQPETKTPLGTLRLVGRQFSFAWTTLDLPELRRQVANCRVEVHHGEQKKVVQLRAAQQEAAIVLDLEKDVQVREFAVADLPKTDLLKLEIVGLDEFVGEPKATPPTVALQKMTKIEFTEPVGAEIEVRFQKLPNGSLAVRLEPKFREGESKTFELTLKRLDNMESGVTRALRAAEKALPRELRELAAKQNALRELRGSQPGNALEIPKWKQAVNTMAADVDRTSRNVARMQKTIPEQKARLEAVPKIRDFLTAMHQKATIRLRVIAECGEHDLVLVEAATASQSTAASPSSE